jgi:hypothetical protein
MNRIEKKNDKFAIAFGADGAMGSYVQVWHHPMEEQDGAFININNLGVTIDEDQPVSIKDIIGESAWQYLMGIKVRYKLAKENGNSRPNIDHETASIFLTKLGFTGLKREIHAAFD